MRKPIPDQAIQQLFTEARSHHHWTENPVSDETLRSLYELLKWGPTSVNSGPARFVFLKSETEKARLYPALMGSNVSQAKAAPVVAIIAYDEKYHEELGRLFPALDVKPLFDGDAKLRQDTAFRNSSLQGAYLVMAARALGLDTCPMSGFNNADLDATFFKDTTWRSNFICTIGYGDDSKVYPRGPRLSFDEACKIV